jgi:hypothetical protein
MAPFKPISIWNGSNENICSAIDPQDASRKKGQRSNIKEIFPAAAPQAESSGPEQTVEPGSQDNSADFPALPVLFSTQSPKAISYYCKL